MLAHPDRHVGSSCRSWHPFRGQVAPPKLLAKTSQILKRFIKTVGFSMIFNIQHVCPVNPKMVILAVMLSHLGALGRHLGSKLLQLGLQDASRWSLEGVLWLSCSKMAPKWPNIAPYSAKLLQNCSPGPPKLQK